MGNEIEQAKIAAEFWTRIANGESREDVLKDLELMSGGSWVLASGDGFGRCTYRWKPKAVKHPGGEYPQPCRDADALLKAGKAYYPDWRIDDEIVCCIAVEVPAVINIDVHLFAKTGMYHLTKEAALQHAGVLFTPNDVDGNNEPA